MSFEKRKQDGFLNKKLAQELNLYHTTPEELNPVRKMAIEYLLSDSWNNYKTYKGIPQWAKPITRNI